jgi:hypothetical protein
MTTARGGYRRHHDQRNCPVPRQYCICRGNHSQTQLLRLAETFRASNNVNDLIACNKTRITDGDVGPRRQTSSQTVRWPGARLKDPGEGTSVHARIRPVAELAIWRVPARARACRCSVVKVGARIRPARTRAWDKRRPIDVRPLFAGAPCVNRHRSRGQRTHAGVDDVVFDPSSR